MRAQGRHPQIYPIRCLGGQRVHRSRVRTSRYHKSYPAPFVPDEAIITHCDLGVFWEDWIYNPDDAVPVIPRLITNNGQELTRHCIF